MAKLDRIWIERSVDDTSETIAIRIDWDNDRHHRVEIEGNNPESVVVALNDLIRVVTIDGATGKI